MSYPRAALVLLLGLYWSVATAQPVGEAAEPSPEERDAAFTSEDAAREAAAFSATIIDQEAVDPVQAMTDAADLVFRGSVSSQSYVYDADGMPSTHTTVAIEEILKGEHPTGEITLVQEGGPAQDGGDQVLMVSSAVLFNVGDEELLFIDLDPDNPIARDRVLVKQRFRVYEGKIYSQDGRGVTIEPVDGGPGRRLVLSSDRHPSEYFRRIHIGPHTLNRNFGSGAGQPDSVPLSPKANARADQGERSYTDSVGVDAFSAAITQ